MNNKKLKLGFIGGGINSAVGYAHYCACQLDGHFELVAGAFSRDGDINRDTAEQYGLSEDQVYHDWRQLLALSETLDALVILTPTPEHQTMLAACMKAGIAVICEKAVTLSSTECAELLALQQQQNSLVQVTYNYSGYPMVRELKALIAKQALGEISHIQVEMPQEGFARLLPDDAKPCPQQWRLHDNAIPTIYLDLAVHLHHLVHFTTQLTPLKTMASQHSYGWFKDVIDDVSAIVEYEQGVKCQYWFSKSSLGHRNGLKIKIYGTQAAAQWCQNHPEQLRLDHINGRTELIERGADCLLAELPRYNRFKAGHPAGFIEAFANLYADFAESIHTHQRGESSLTSADYDLTISQQGLQLLEAMVKSTTTHTWESVCQQ